MKVRIDYRLYPGYYILTILGTKVNLTCSRHTSGRDKVSYKAGFILRVNLN